MHGSRQCSRYGDEPDPQFRGSTLLDKANRINTVEQLRRYYARTEAIIRKKVIEIGFPPPPAYFEDNPMDWVPAEIADFWIKETS